MADKKANGSYASTRQLCQHMTAMPPARQLETVKLDAFGLISGVLALHVTLYHKQLIDHSKYQATTVPTMPEMRPDASDLSKLRINVVVIKSNIQDIWLPLAC